MGPLKSFAIFAGTWALCSAGFAALMYFVGLQPHDPATLNWPVFIAGSFGIGLIPAGLIWVTTTQPTVVKPAPGGIWKHRWLFLWAVFFCILHFGLTGSNGYRFHIGEAALAFGFSGFLSGVCWAFWSQRRDRATSLLTAETRRVLAQQIKAQLFAYAGKLRDTDKAESDIIIVQVSDLYRIASAMADPSVWWTPQQRNYSQGVISAHQTTVKHLREAGVLKADPVLDAACDGIKALNDDRFDADRIKAGIEPLQAAVAA